MQGCCCTCFRWKDPDNVFRKHPKFELTGVPTLMQWGSVSPSYIDCMHHILCSQLVLSALDLTTVKMVYRFLWGGGGGGGCYLLPLAGKKGKSFSW